MAINCEKCEYFDEDYLFDEETCDEFPFFLVIKTITMNCMMIFVHVHILKNIK